MTLYDGIGMSLQSQAGLPQNSSGGPARRRHGWNGRWLRAGPRDQMNPREDFQFSFLWKGLYIPHCPTQIRARRPGPTVREWHVPTVTAWTWTWHLPTWTLQPLPISHSGGCTSPRCSFPAVLQSQAGLPRNQSGGPARRRHGWSGWRRRAGPGRSSPATRSNLFKRLPDLYHLRFR